MIHQVDHASSDAVNCTKNFAAFSAYNRGIVAVGPPSVGVVRSFPGPDRRRQLVQPPGFERICPWKCTHPVRGGRDGTGRSLWAAARCVSVTTTGGHLLAAWESGRAQINDECDQHFLAAKFGGAPIMPFDAFDGSLPCSPPLPFFVLLSPHSSRFSSTTDMPGGIGRCSRALVVTISNPTRPLPHTRAHSKKMIS